MRTRSLTAILLLALAAVLTSTRPAHAQWPLHTLGSILPAESSGSLTANSQCVTLPVLGYPGIGIQLAGTFTADLVFEASANGTNYRALNLTPSNGSTPVSTASAVGYWQGSLIGASHVRACTTAFTSGTINVTLRATMGGGAGGSGGGGGGGGTEFAEDAGHTTADAGTLIFGVRNDAGTVLAGTTLDYIPFSMDATGALRVTGGAGGTSSNFGAAIPSAGTAIGVSDGTNMVAPRAVDADTGAGTVFTLTTNSVFRTSGTPVEAGTSTNPWNVVFPSAQAVTVASLPLPTGAATLAEQQTQTTALQLLDNAISGAGFNITQLNGVNVTMGNGASGTGVQRVTIANDSTGTLAVTQATAANLNAQVVGSTAADAAASGNPVQIAGFGSSAVPSAMSANGDVTRPWLSLFGAVNTIVRDSAGDSAMDDTNNAIRVNVVAGGAGGTNMTDDAAFTPATTAFTPIGGTYRSSLDLLDDNDGGAVAMTQRRALHFSIRRESDGAEWGIAATAPVAVRFSDGSSFLNLASDSTHDSAVTSTGPLQLLEAASDMSANTAVADGDAVRAIGDLLGRTITVNGCDRAARLRSVTTVTDGSSTSAIAAQGAGVFAEIHDVVIANTSATAVTVDLRDGTGGSVMATFPVPADTAGVVHSFRVPITGTANTAVAVDPSAAASSIIVTLTACKVK